MSEINSLGHLGILQDEFPLGKVDTINLSHASQRTITFQVTKHVVNMSGFRGVGDGRLHQIQNLRTRVVPWDSREPGIRNSILAMTNWVQLYRRGDKTEELKWS